MNQADPALSFRRASFATAALLLVCTACGESTATVDAPGAADAPVAVDTVADAAPVAPPPPCPTTGDNSLVVTGASCVVFTPTVAGADAAGVNADKSNYALAPTTGARGRLMLFINPSLGNPGQSIGDPQSNIYTAAIAAGDHALGVAYRSNLVIGAPNACGGNDACFLPTRMAIVTGLPQGPASAVRDIKPTESIYSRTALALTYLVAAQPSAGWQQYIVAGVDPVANPAGAVRWDKVIVTGHSQGGGHTLLLAKLQSVARLVTLASPCDAVGITPATWMSVDATWKSSPAAIGWGFGQLTTFDANGVPNGGDTTCSAHAAIWNTLQFAAPRIFEDAVNCAGANPHTAPTKCPANMPRVQAMFTM